MSVLQAIIDLIGDVPKGYEVVAWMAASVALLFIVASTFKILGAVVSFTSGRR